MSGNAKLFYQQNILMEKNDFFAKVFPSSFREFSTNTIEFFFHTITCKYISLNVGMELHTWDENWLLFSRSVLNPVKFIVLKLFERYIYSNTCALQMWFFSVSI